MIALKTIIALLLFLSRGGYIVYDHIDGAASGFYTVYNAAHECIADDIQITDIYDVIK